jgi:hypothetical protein
LGGFIFLGASIFRSSFHYPTCSHYSLFCKNTNTFAAIFLQKELKHAVRSGLKHQGLLLSKDLTNSFAKISNFGQAIKLTFSRF